MRWIMKPVKHRFGGRATVIAAVTPLLILALAGCGGSSSSPGIATAKTGKTTTASPSASAGQADPLKFAQCMREHGVNMPDPENGKVTIQGGPGDKTKIDAAQKACAKYSPGAGGGRGGPPMSKADQAKLLQFAQCMRQHGVDMADPDFSGGGVGLSIKGDGQTDKVEAAQKACNKLMPAEMQDAKPGTTTLKGDSK